MSTQGRILISDDDETFLHSMADLLRREHYVCDCAVDGDAARVYLENNRYDLLIADIKMPGNTHLELIEAMPDTAEGVPVILVTGYPSLDSAITSIKLPVAAYLVKPIDFEELLSHVRTSIEQSKMYQVVKDTREHLELWLQKTTTFERLMKEGAKKAVHVNDFIEFSFQNLVSTLADLKNLSNSQLTEKTSQEVCHLLNCPRLHSLTDALEEAIGVLEKTKNSFKSKDLGELREKLEKVVQQK